MKTRSRHTDEEIVDNQLFRCAQEPIHTPDAIQPHGALLAALADRPSFVTHASANLRRILGHSARAVLGKPLGRLIGQTAYDNLAGCGPRDGVALGNIHVLPGPDGDALHLQAHRSGPYICVDIERLGPGLEHRPPLLMAQSVLRSFKQARSCSDLSELAVNGLRAITGYDRVMAYRFDLDGHGEVVAEAHADHLKPYLGQRYPASDMPPQARQQYMRQRVGAVANAGYRPVPLLTHPTLGDGIALDLTHSSLRSVSPIHREYMRNMGTAASLTIGLAQDNHLWGMLVCHHETRRITGPELRAVADMIGQVVSSLLSSLGRADVLAERLGRDTALCEIMDRLAGSSSLAEALSTMGPELLYLTDAVGFAALTSDGIQSFGRTPPKAVIENVLAMLQPVADGKALPIDDFGLRHSGLVDGMDEFSGVLLLPLAQDGNDAILWFRPELALTVTWAGNPAAHATWDLRTGRLSPRASFAAWTNAVRGHSAPWRESDLELARELRVGIEADLARRTRTQLAHLRDHFQELSINLEIKVEQRTRALEDELEKRQKIAATLQQARKMEAIGQLTGGVAHDFNNVLTAILGNLDLAQGNGSKPEVEQFLQNAHHAAERGAKLTDRLLSFARKQPLRREPCDLNQLIVSLSELIARTIGSIVEIRLALVEDIWPVLADATQFETALLNLAVNARDAMPHGGILTIITSNVPAGSSELPDDLAIGDYACVSVRDTGTGMDAEVAGKAFEPFYTTKEVGKGTGLGLSQVYGFSKQLGGGATLASNVDAGTDVGLFLPRAVEAMTAIPMLQVLPAELPPELKRTRSRILVVDDEPDVLDVTADVLRALGFEVVAAESARRGLEVLNQARRIDLLLSDFSMPEMNGIVLIQQARAAYPRLPCLLVTGYAEINNFIDASLGNIPILRKPYRMKELSATVNKLLAEARQTGDPGPDFLSALPTVPQETILSSSLNA